MRPVSKQTKGFTLVEVLITMILSSLLVILAFNQLRLMGFHLRQFRIASQQILNIREFKESLDFLAFRSRFIYIRENSLMFTDRDDKEIGRLDFFPETTLISMAGPLKALDTIHLEISEIKCYWRNQEIFSGILDACELEFDYQGEPSRISLYKSYSSSDQIKIKQNEY